MRKLNLKPYLVTLPTPDGQTRSIPYDVKRSIEGVVLASGPATSQRLSMAQLLRNAKVTDKIMECKNDFILLEDADYNIIKTAFNAFQGFGVSDVELCRRIDSAEEVEVTEKPNGKPKKQSRKQERR